LVGVVGEPPGEYAAASCREAKEATRRRERNGEVPAGSGGG